ncbi:hypothetical protein DSM100688_0198 [Bifidobacterium ramosum]|uniref:Uncharacterized protein n=1 Tax=Bifidobacterium ramosum TaxID=1798158 RepID=A0A6L4X2I2_9BIFI|nr:hypothetical protein [Bifidobacterium ramosum]KAB8289120.1 hypothetical protein DSM100688_0198 [Bifidobacterium ramosum]NEG70832.1 hypothetical protein [Bifidobacterium ramosum]
MNGQIERHISVTRQTADGTVIRADVHVSAVHPDPATRPGVQPDALAGVGAGCADDAVVGVDGAAGSGDCFDPDTCCDARERALIMAMRAYLRPDVAPECLMRRLRETLDHCCCDDADE